MALVVWHLSEPHRSVMNLKIFPRPASEPAQLTYCRCNRYTKLRSEVNSSRRQRRRPQRTSTPADSSEFISERNDTSTSSSHSVSEFFYQSWKNELNSDMCEQSDWPNQPPTSGYFIQNFNYYIVNCDYHPVWHPSHMVLVNPWNSYFVFHEGPVIYCPAVGYRTDGTYGVLPGFWICYSYSSTDEISGVHCTGAMTDAAFTTTRKEWRKLAKKMRRKRIRQQRAELRKREEKIRDRSPTYLTVLAKERLLKEHELELQEKERQKRYEKWLKDEEESQKLWKEQQYLKELAREEKMKELERIRFEWEAEQQRIKKRKEELESIRQAEEKRKQSILERINEFIINGGEVPRELMAVTETNSGKELCSFFAKVGACRFGHQCSRNHLYPGISTVLLFPNFYSHFTLDQSHTSEYDTDIGLEFEDSDKYLHFEDFYKDVAPEFKKYGTVRMIKVCCNTESHLRGNVYVEYSTLREALFAYQKFHGRWYGSKQLTVEFVNINEWGRAVCGDHARNRCPKGKSCNFLHVFKNPSNEFPVEWNRLKTIQSASPCESYANNNSSVKDRSFRWSESPVRIEDDNKKKTNENRDRHQGKGRRRKRSRSRSIEERVRRHSYGRTTHKKKKSQ